MEDWHTPSQAGELPPAGRVLAFAPHPDDETFGCGGALARYAQAGAQVTVVVLTDGAAQVDAAEREAHAAARQAETRAALACLGVTDALFWRLPDRSLAGHAGLAERIGHALREAAPEVVLAPSLWEIHPDHLATGRAVLQAAQAMARADDRPPAEGHPGPEAATPELLLYEVGGAQRVNLLLDITPVWSAKARAMACFASQQERQDYARHIEALNIWRTYTLPASVRHAEGYTHLRPADLRADLRAEGGAEGGAGSGAEGSGAGADPVVSFVRLAGGELIARAAASQESLRAQLHARDAALRASIDDFHRAMAQRDAAVIELQQQLRGRLEVMRASIDDFHRAMAQRDAAVAALEHALAERDAAARVEVEGLRQAAARRDAALEALRQELTRREAAFAEALAQHAAATEEARQRLAQREARFAEILAARDAEIAGLQARLAHAESSSDQLRGYLLAMQRSTSWRLTAPLRWVMSRLRGR